MRPPPEAATAARGGLSPVVVETRYPAPNSLPAIAEMTKRNQWCLIANRAQPLLHALDVPLDDVLSVLLPDPGD